MIFKKTLIFVLTIILSSAVSTVLAVTEIHWWHGMGGALGERVNEIADKFNQHQSEYKLTVSYKGNYAETMTAGIAAFRARRQPHILQVYEVGTAVMMQAKRATKPVYQIMADANLPFDSNDYISAVVSYYSNADNQMLSMPFNSSTPVLYYNKEAFKKAGLDPEQPPKTWEEMGEYSRKLVASGYECGFSTSWQSWIHLENLGAWHNIPFGTKENGFAGLDTEFTFNSPLHLKHIQQLADWQKEKIFVYGGRRNVSNAKFSSGQCAMFTESSAGYAGFKKAAKFDFGIANLPYWSDVKGVPQNTIIGGSSLWVLAGHKANEYKGVATFFAFLSSPEIQTFWHENTGYVPITTAVYESMKKQGFYEKNPGRDIPILQMSHKKPTPQSKGLRFGNFVQIRDIINQELEAIWAGKKTAQQGLDSAVKRGNIQLRQFEKMQK